MNFKSLLFVLGALAATTTEARVGGEDSEQQHRELLGHGSYSYSDWASRCCGQDNNAACRCPIRNIDAWGNLERWDRKCAEQLGQNIVETAVGAGNFTTLVDLVTLAGLGDTLSGPGPFTVFAPTDTAFGTLDDATVELLTSEDGRDDLTSILTYHVVPGKILAADLTDGAQVTTVEGTTVTITLPTMDGEFPKVNDANIIQTDIEANNGVIHVIDGVLTPN